MVIRKVGTVGGALIVRLTKELKEVDIKLGDNVNVVVNNGRVIISKFNDESLS